jgi:isocitrate/isopropylmalate dehydrogenase
LNSQSDASKKHKQVSEIISQDIDNEVVREKVMQLYEDLNEEERTRLNKSAESVEAEINQSAANIITNCFYCAQNLPG